MSFSTDSIVRAWASTHGAPVEEAFSDFLVVGLSTEDVKARVPYVVQVDGTVAFGEIEPVTIEYVEMSDLTPSERVDFAVGETGLGSTVVALSIRSNVSSYVRRSKSGKAVRVKSYFRMIDASDLRPGDTVLDRHDKRRVVDRVNGSVVTFKGGGTATGKFQKATPNYVSGKAAKNTIVKDIKPAFNPQAASLRAETGAAKIGPLTKMLKAVKRELIEGGDGAIAGKDFSHIDGITGRRWDAEGYPKGTKARHTPQGVEVEQSRPSLTPEQQAMATGIGKTGPSARKVGNAAEIENEMIRRKGRNLPADGDFSNLSDDDLAKELDERERDVGLYPGAEGPRDAVRAEVEKRAALRGMAATPKKKSVGDLSAMSPAQLDALEADIHKRGQGVNGEYQPGSLREVVYERAKAVSAAPYPSKAVPASDIKPNDLIDLDGNVRVVKSATPAGDSILLSTTAPKGGDVQNSVVKKTSMVKKLVVALATVLLAIGVGHVGEHIETDYHPPEESISQMMEGRGAVGISAPSTAVNPGFRITAPRKKTAEPDWKAIEDEERAGTEIARARMLARDDDAEYIVEDDPNLAVANRLAGKVTTDGGFTYNPRTSKYVEHGFAVAMPGNSVIVKDADVPDQVALASVIKKYLNDHEDKVFSNGRIQVGGWHDTEHGEVVLDLSEIFEDQIEAMRAGTERDEQAIFNLDTFETIPTGGTGGRVELSMLVDEYLALANGSIPLSTSNYAWEEEA